MFSEQGMQYAVWSMKYAECNYEICNLGTMHYGSTKCVWHSDISLRILIGVLISTNSKSRLAHHLCQWQIDCNSLTSIMNKTKSEILAWIYSPIFQFQTSLAAKEMLDRLLPRVQTSPTHMDSEWRAPVSKVCQFLSGLSLPMCVCDQWPIIYMGWRSGICTPPTLIRGLDAVLCPFVINKTWSILKKSKKLTSVSFLDKKMMNLCKKNP